MKLSLMNKVVNTLTAHRSSPLAAAFAEKWFSEVDSIKYIRASANFVFQVKANGKSYILRFNSVLEKDIRLVEDEIAVLRYLLDNGLSVSAPVKSQANRYLEIVKTELGVFTVVLFEKANGQVFEVDQIDDERTVTWGSKLGELHCLLKKVPQDIANSRLSYKVLLEFIKQYISEYEQFLLQEYQALSASLKKIPIDNDNFGLIHFDFDIDNILWNDRDITIIDFDDMVKLWFGADILFAVRSLFYNKPLDLNNQKLKLFIQGYKRKTSFDEEMLNHFPDFLRLHRLFFIARLRRSLDIKDTSNYPEWIGRLTAKIKQNYINSSIEDIKAGRLTVR